MTIHDFISQHQLAPLARPAHSFFPPWLAANMPPWDPLDIYRDNTRTLWVAMAPKQNLFRVFHCDVARLTGYLDQHYPGLRSF